MQRTTSPLSEGDSVTVVFVTNNHCSPPTPNKLSES